LAATATFKCYRYQLEKEISNPNYKNEIKESEDQSFADVAHFLSKQSRAIKNVKH